MLARSVLRQTSHAARRCGHDLVGSPDPVSNLRPVIYNRVAADPPRPHPYSVNEFPPMTESVDPNLNSVDFEWNIARARLDAFNHSFWADNNSRFHAEKSEALDAVHDPHDREQVEEALAEFYKYWLEQESDRLQIYNRSWNRANAHLLMLALRKRFTLINRAYGRLTRGKME